MVSRHSLNPKSLLIVGGGITGLCLAAAARARGHVVTVIASDPMADTASGVAAGMIAPALEALNDPDPALSYRRMQAAQAAWLEDFAAWPATVQDLLAEAQSRTSLYLVDQSDPWAAEARLRATGAAFARLGWDDMRREGLDPEAQAAFAVPGDWLVEAVPLLAALRAALAAGGAAFIDGTAVKVTVTQVTLSTGAVHSGDAVVITAGYAARHFADAVPSLAVLRPIKGHLLDLKTEAGQGVVRSDAGYFANYGTHAKFGASMQFDQADTAVEPEVVADLKARAGALAPESNIASAVPRTGVRAATPDGWPLIGRDAASGVWVAAGMRRNGYIFAPMAARLILDAMAGDVLPGDAAAYDPNRF